MARIWLPVQLLQNLSSGSLGRLKGREAARRLLKLNKWGFIFQRREEFVPCMLWFSYFSVDRWLMFDGHPYGNMCTFNTSKIFCLFPWHYGSCIALLSKKDLGHHVTWRALCQAVGFCERWVRIAHTLRSTWALPSVAHRATISGWPCCWITQ